MSDHAKTLRRALQEFDDEVPQGDSALAADALAALDELVAENQQLRDVGGRALVALEELCQPKYGVATMQFARAALDGTSRAP